MIIVVAIVITVAGIADWIGLPQVAAKLRRHSRAKTSSPIQFDEGFLIEDDYPPKLDGE